jgi:hypothetical protein
MQGGGEIEGEGVFSEQDFRLTVQQ